MSHRFAEKACIVSRERTGSAVLSFFRFYACAECGFRLLSFARECTACRQKENPGRSIAGALRFEGIWSAGILRLPAELCGFGTHGAAGFFGFGTRRKRQKAIAAFSAWRRRKNGGHETVKKQNRETLSRMLSESAGRPRC